MPGDKDNTHAGKYINRVTNKANLEASNALFIKDMKRELMSPQTVLIKIILLLQGEIGPTTAIMMVGGGMIHFPN